MAKRGRKPLPTKIKEKKGTLDKSRVIDDEMKPDAVNSIPMAPEWLTDVGKKEWYRVARQLSDLGVLSELDLTPLALYCNEISVYIECEKLLREKQRVLFFKDDDGKLKYAQAVPYQQIADKALKKAMDIATEFGLTPSSRTRISIGQASLISYDDPANEWLD